MMDDIYMEMAKQIKSTPVLAILGICTYIHSSPCPMPMLYYIQTI